MKTWKKLKWLLFVSVLGLGIIEYKGNAYAEEEFVDIEGSSATYELKNGVLTIAVEEGMTSDLPDYSREASGNLRDEQLIDTVTKVIIKENINNIGDYTFCDYKNLKEVVIGENVKTIGTSAFEGCDNLEKVAIKNNVEEMGPYCFANCKKLRDITLSNGLSEISDFMFKDCINLKSISIPANITYIGDGAFAQCRTLANVAFAGNKVNEICTYAFADTAITNIYIPDSVEYIDDSAFSKCLFLEKIWFLSSKNDAECYLSDNVFDGCDSIKNIYAYPGSYVYETLMNICKDKLTKLTYIDTSSGKCSVVFQSTNAFVYSGKRITPKVEFYYEGISKKIVDPSDYSVSYVNNVKAGTATVIITGKNNYYGTVKKNFVIQKRNIKNCSINKLTKKTYTGKAIKPTMSVKIGTLKLSKTNYSIRYVNNTKTGKASVIITGKGNCTGRVTRYFYIIPKSLTRNDMRIVRTSQKIEFQMNRKYANYNKSTLVVRYRGRNYTSSKGKVIIARKSKKASKATIYVIQNKQKSKKISINV